jgi:hypothetical protein
VFTGPYVADEAVAVKIRTWEPLLVPGLLQIEHYAWAVIGARWPDDPEGVQRRVMARMARHTMLSRPDAPTLTAIMDEAVLPRPVGGAEVMGDQLRELLRPRGNVTIRVVPFAAGVHPGLEVLRMTAAAGPDTVTSCPTPLDASRPELADEPARCETQCDGSQP